MVSNSHWRLPDFIASIGLSRILVARPECSRVEPGRAHCVAKGRPVASSILYPLVFSANPIFLLSCRWNRYGAVTVAASNKPLKHWRFDWGRATKTGSPYTAGSGYARNVTIYHLGSHWERGRRQLVSLSSCSEDSGSSDSGSVATTPTSQASFHQPFLPLCMW